jgi:hypothetical protein
MQRQAVREVRRRGIGGGMNEEELKQKILHLCKESWNDGAKAAIEAAAELCDKDAAFGKSGHMQSMAESHHRDAIASELAKEIRRLIVVIK